MKLNVKTQHNTTHFTILNKCNRFNSRQNALVIYLMKRKQPVSLSSDFGKFTDYISIDYLLEIMGKSE